MHAWDSFLTAQDRQVFQASGYGARGGYGQRPALLVIDVNYAFCGDGPEPILDSIKTWHNSCGEAAWKAIPFIQAALGEARYRRIPVFFSTGIDGRPDGFDSGGWARKNARTSEDLTPSYGNEIIREIKPLPNEIVIRKYKPSIFHGTALLGFLVDLGIDTVLVCGTTTSGCVRASVVDAFSYNFRVSVIEEATFDRGEASHAINLWDMNAKYADIVSAEDALQYLGTLPSGLYDDKMHLNVPETPR